MATVIPPTTSETAPVAAAKPQHFVETLTLGLTKLVTLLPVVGPFVKDYLPTDKPGYQSATVKAGALWALVETLCATLPMVLPQVGPTCAVVVGIFRVASPILMFLGVRKGAVAAASGQ